MPKLLPITALIALAACNSGKPTTLLDAGSDAGLCRSDSDCAPSRLCNGAGQCVLRPGACGSNMDCADGGTCDIDGLCVGGVVEDAGVDAGDAGVDAGEIDAGIDAGVDAGLIDAGSEDAGLDAGPIANEEAQLQVVATGIVAFHQNTGGWPLGAGVWWVVPPSGDAGPLALPGTTELGLPCSPNDTVLFTTPSDPALATCANPGSGGLSDPCWDGPYLSGPTNIGLGSPQWYDAWGNPLLFMYLPPPNNPGGGATSPYASNGEIVIWSTGPDGKDGFACTDGSCDRNLNSMAVGNPSDPDAGDIIVVVSNNAG